MEWIKSAWAWATQYPQVWQWTMFVVYIIIGYIVVRVVKRVFEGIIRLDKLPVMVVKLLRTTVVTIVWMITFMQALQAIGVNIVSILGAAGVAGMAIGFASQTALSNVISGVFLVTERSVKIGDFIRVNGCEGTVERVNLMSVWLRQVDNALVRVPNESLIQNPVVNVTGDELRRCDFAVGVEYSSNLKQVREVILEVIEDHVKILDTPAPVIQFKGFGDSSLDLFVGAWVKTKDYHDVRYDFAVQLLKAFKQNNIGIPFPTRTLLMEQVNATPKEKI